MYLLYNFYNRASVDQFYFFYKEGNFIFGEPIKKESYMKTMFVDCKYIGIILQTNWTFILL